MKKQMISKDEILTIMNNYFAMHNENPSVMIAMFCENADQYKALNTSIKKSLVNCDEINKYKYAVDFDLMKAFYNILDKFNLFKMEIQNNKELDIFDFCEMFYNDRVYFSALKHNLPFLANLRNVSGFGYIPYYDELARESHDFSFQLVLRERTVLEGKYVIDGEEVTLEEKQAFLDTVKHYEIKSYKKLFNIFIRHYRKNNVMYNSQNITRTRV